MKKKCWRIKALGVQRDREKEWKWDEWKLEVKFQTWDAGDYERGVAFLGNDSVSSFSTWHVKIHTWSRKKGCNALAYSEAAPLKPPPRIQPTSRRWAKNAPDNSRNRWEFVHQTHTVFHERSWSICYLFFREYSNKMWFLAHQKDLGRWAGGGKCYGRSHFIPLIAILNDNWESRHPSACHPQWL